MEEMKNKILQLINEECQKLTNHAHGFMLWNTTPEEIGSFSFEKLLLDLERLSPFLLSIFKEISSDRLPVTCAAICIALRGRQPRMSAFAYYVNTILQHGGFRKAAFNRLCTLGITTSYGHAVGKQKEFAERYGGAMSKS